MDTNKTLPTPLNVTFKRPFNSSQGWEDIGNLTGQHSAPFQLYNDDGKTFLQVSQSVLRCQRVECLDTTGPRCNEHFLISNKGLSILVVR